MDAKTIEQMLRKLKPVVKNGRRAEQLLQNYWADKIALVWTAEHVHRAANEIRIALTRQEAIQVLQHFNRTHNRQSGLRWIDLTGYIEEKVLGRELTAQELNRFVKKDQITVQKR